ncbi:MAG: molybdopterin-synthase adenylyltransferase MoeB [Haloferacaceae archaeon]
MSLSLDPTQLDRYSRHVIMDEVGPEGQAALLDASVLVVGCGGLGAPVIQYLAAAGVGSLTLVDDDAVERSNLQRQVIHADADVGAPKVESARDYVERLNPDVSVDAREVRVARPNAADLVADHDLVVDGSDNFPTRYLLNDACRLASLPLVHGAVYKFEGQATTLVPDGPCYRCLFPEAPEPGTIPDCATTGVLGVLPGAVGAIQATEAVKLVVGFGDPLVGRLLFYDAADTTFETAEYRARPSCPVCGDDPIESLDEVTYAEGCAVEA